MRLIATTAALALLACSAGGDSPDKTIGGPQGPGSSGDGTNDDMVDQVGMGGLDSDDLAPGMGANGNPPNIGSEELCDGVDENNNGIIDDVDKGEDGLCDCLHIGFFGGISGESGQSTGSFKTWLESRSDVPVVEIGGTESLSAGALEDLQVVIIGNLVQRTYSGNAPYYSSSEISAFGDWIDAGGGVFALAGYTSQATAAAPTNELLAPTGLSYDLTTYPGSGTWTQSNTSNGVSYVVNAFVEHPTTDGVTDVGVFHGYPVQGDGTVVATDGGHNVGIAKEVGDGHAFIWADEWITNDSEWTDRDDLQVARFWLNTIRWLTPANECQVPIPDIIR